MLPNETEDLLVVQGQDYATLITCTPYGVNTHRLLVRGHRVPYDVREKEMITKPFILEDWMIVFSYWYYLHDPSNNLFKKRK